LLIATLVVSDENETAGSTRGHQLSFARHLQRSIARVCDGPVRTPNLKEPFSLEGDIQRIVCRLDVSLDETPLGRNGHRAVSDLDLDWLLDIWVGGFDARFECLVHQILKLGTGFFESRRIYVGEIMSDQVHVELLCVHSRRRGA
jgi:hypothetical protein